MKITIYHNPRCSKSRRSLALLEELGIAPQIVPYLDEPPPAERTLELAGQLGVRVRDLLRQGEDEFKAARGELDLDDDLALARWLEQHPRVLQRPIVVDEERGRAVIGRPPENVLEFLSA